MYREINKISSLFNISRELSDYVCTRDDAASSNSVNHDAAGLIIFTDQFSVDHSQPLRIIQSNVPLNNTDPAEPLT